MESWADDGGLAVRQPGWVLELDRARRPGPVSPASWVRQCWAWAGSSRGWSADSTVWSSGQTRPESDTRDMTSEQLRHGKGNRGTGETGHPGTEW